MQLYFQNVIQINGAAFTTHREDGVAHATPSSTPESRYTTAELELARCEEEGEVPHMRRMAKGAANIAILLARR